MSLDILFINPGNSKAIYQDLAKDYSAIETPTWALLLAQSMRSVGFSAGIFDVNAERLSTTHAVEKLKKADDQKTHRKSKVEENKSVKENNRHSESKNYSQSVAANGSCYNDVSSLHNSTLNDINDLSSLHNRTGFDSLTGIFLYLFFDFKLDLPELLFILFFYQCSTI